MKKVNGSNYVNVLGQGSGILSAAGMEARHKVLGELQEESIEWIQKCFNAWLERVHDACPPGPGTVNIHCSTNPSHAGTGIEGEHYQAYASGGMPIYHEKSPCTFTWAVVDPNNTPGSVGVDIRSWPSLKGMESLR